MRVCVALNTMASFLFNCFSVHYNCRKLPFRAILFCRLPRRVLLLPHKQAIDFMKKILVILGHPSASSFNHALAQHYVKSASEAGHDVQLLELGKLTFDPILREGYQQRQELEPDLQAAWQQILWAEHLVLVFPTWWGVAPALLKGFFDRLFLPGMAFKYRPDSQFWDKLLSGRSARIITTMDSPKIYNWLVYRNANIRSVRQATLEYCGIKPVSVTVFDRLRFADEKRRVKMLEKVGKMGRMGK